MNWEKDYVQDYMSKYTTTYELPSTFYSLSKLINSHTF